jgi:hypothetical protein
MTDIRKTEAETAKSEPEKPLPGDWQFNGKVTDF